MTQTPESESVTDFIPFLKNQWLKRQNQNQLLTLFLSWRINNSNARIRISTKEVKVNTQQVLAVSDLTGKPLRLHRPSRFASCLLDWVPDSMADPWIKVSRLSGLPSPKQQTVLLVEREFSYGFFVKKRLPCPLLASLGNWKEGGAQLPRDSERLEERV